MRLIGLNGRRGSGKDTVYRFIAEDCKQLGLVAHRVAFADPLKVSALRALGYDGSPEECVLLADRIKAEGAFVTTAYTNGEGGCRVLRISGREYLQRYGTEAHRDVFGDTFWIDVALPKHEIGGSGLVAGEETEAFRARKNEQALRKRYPGADVLVITDVRFENEASRVRALGGEVWEIVRPSLHNEDSHASEQPLPYEMIDRHIPNDGSLAALANSTFAALGS